MVWFGKRQRSEAEVRLEQLRAETPSATSGLLADQGSPTESRFAPASLVGTGTSPEEAKEQSARIAAEGSVAAFGVPFEMTVQDVFTITGRGTVVTGEIVNGFVAEGMTVRVASVGGPLETTVTGIETAKKQVPAASIGDHVGLLLAEVGSDDVARGDTITG